MKTTVFRDVTRCGIHVSEECTASIIRVTRIGELRDDEGDKLLRNVGFYKSHTA
jgi:hypothetical protein